VSKKHKERIEQQFQQARRKKLKEESELAVLELNQKIIRLTEDLVLLTERVKTLEGNNG